LEFSLGQSSAGIGLKWVSKVISSRRNSNEKSILAEPAVFFCIKLDNSCFFSLFTYVVKRSLHHYACLRAKMQKALLLQKLIWAKMPCAAFQRRIPIYSTSHQRFRLHTLCSTIEQSAPSLELIAASPFATQLIAHYFASSILPGDAYLLYGEVGAGKSHFR